MVPKISSKNSSLSTSQIHNTFALSKGLTHFAPLTAEIEVNAKCQTKTNGRAKKSDAKKGYTSTFPIMNKPRSKHGKKFYKTLLSYENEKPPEEYNRDAESFRNAKSPQQVNLLKTSKPKAARSKEVNNNSPNTPEVKKCGITRDYKQAFTSMLTSNLKSHLPKMPENRKENDMAKNAVEPCWVSFLVKYTVGSG